MKRKYKLTGFARLFIFLLFFLPIVYVGVSMYHGENPLEKIGSIFQGEDRNQKPRISKEVFGVQDPEVIEKEIKSRDEEIEYLRKRVDELEKLVLELKSHNH